MRKLPTLSWSFTKLGLCHIILHQIAILWLFVSWNISVQGLTSNRFNKNDFKYDNMSTVVSKESVESSLKIIHDIANENIGTLCVTKSYSSLKIQLNTERYDGARQKADLAAVVLQDVGFVRHGGLLDALAKGLLSDPHVISARILATNLSSGILSTSIWWAKQIGTLNEPIRVEDEGVTVGSKPSKDYPWFEDAITSPGLRSPKFSASPPNVSFKGWWTFPYYSCNQGKWLLSYSVAIAPQKHHELRGFLSIDVDVSQLYINQCDINNNFYNGILHSQPWSSKIPFNRLSQSDHEQQQYSNQQLLPPPQQQQHPLGLNDEIEVFHGSHKCHQDSMDCEFRPQYATGLKTVVNGWTRGSYQCMCKIGFYSSRHPDGFNGTIMEVAYMEFQDNSSSYYVDSLICLPCAPGCAYCIDNSPCLASYNWPFRIALLTTSILCVFFTLGLSIYLFHNRKVKVFKVASPIFLTITLLGCAIMYLEMAAIFPILDTYACIATKWTRHMGFCITYTALLMKTWRVSLTYRVKSAHKVKLTDQQLLQWMIPVLLVMIIYLGTWTVSAPPYADNIKDIKGLLFKQCSYNWWDHSLAIGEVLFLLWGIRVCYNVRNAESMYNESKMISYAIYNIAFVNTLMVAIHLIIFPEAGPDIKYLLGFVRTQLSTSVTIALVFGPKIIRVLRGQGDQWDQRARVRGITASYPINGIGLVKEEPIDPYQENEELKEEIQKLAAQIEFMKIVNMEVNNRHLRPKAGGYFTLQSPMGKSLKYSHKKQLQALCNTSRSSDTSKQENSGIVEDGHSGSNISSSGGVGKESISNSATNSSLPTQKNPQEKESSSKSEKSKPEKSKPEKSNGTEKV